MPDTIQFRNVLSQGNEIKVKVIAPFLFFKFWLYNKTQRSFANTVIEKEGIFEGDIIFNFRFYFLLFFKYVIPFEGEAQEKDEEITSSNADTVAIGTNSDDTDSDLSPLPTEEILLSQVTDEMKEEVNILKQIFVQESKNEKAWFSIRNFETGRSGIC